MGGLRLSLATAVASYVVGEFLKPGKLHLNLKLTIASLTAVFVVSIR